MIAEDTTAFVERLEVAGNARDVERQQQAVVHRELELLEAQMDLRVALQMLEGLERELAELRTDTGSRVKRLRAGSIEREIERMQTRRSTCDRRVAEKRDRLADAEAQLRELDANQRAARVLRLHSAQHYLEVSARWFDEKSRDQQDLPVLVTRQRARRWWWYLDRFWWGDAGMGARDVRARVLELDLERSLRASELAHARSVALGLDAPHEEPLDEAKRLEIWRRYRGRCVDCGATEQVLFDRILPRARGGSDSTANFEVRCTMCRDRRVRNEAQATLGHARLDAEPRPRRFHDAVRRRVWARDDGRCVDCGSDVGLELDHILSPSKGGADLAPNLELRCEACRSRRYRRRAWLDDATDHPAPESPTAESLEPVGAPGIEPGTSRV